MPEAMRIVHLAAGSGGFYCGACARDISLVRGLIARGHDVTVVPLYLPLRLDDASIKTGPVQLDGINAYLQHGSFIFRHTPAWLDRLLASGFMLRFAGRFAGTTRAAKLGPLTVSMLKGSDGSQHKQVGQLMEYLASGSKPAAIVITNALLIGLAPALKRRLGVPVLCGLQGEEGFLSDLPQPWRDEAMTLVRSHAAAVDRFLAPHASHAAAMATWLGVDRQRITVLPPSLDTKVYRPGDAPLPTQPLTIGFCSVLIARKGADLLVEAVGKLPAELRARTRLVIAGQHMDGRHVEAVRKRAAALGLAAEFPGELDLNAKLTLMRSSHVFCVPSREPEARGMVMLEALACGSYLVAPEAGIYPELAAACPGVGLFKPGMVEDLTRALLVPLTDPVRAREQALAGAQALVGRHGQAAIAQAAEAMIHEIG